MKIAYIDRSFVCFFASYRINYFQQFLNLKFFSFSVLLTYGIRTHWKSLLIQLTQIFFRREVRKRKTWSKLIIKSVDKKGECVTLWMCVCIICTSFIFILNEFLVSHHMLDLFLPSKACLSLAYPPSLHLQLNSIFIIIPTLYWILSWFGY